MGQFDRADRYTRLFRLCPSQERFDQTLASYGEAFANEYARTPLELGAVPDYPQRHHKEGRGGEAEVAGHGGGRADGALEAEPTGTGGAKTSCGRNFGLLVIDKKGERDALRAARPRHIPRLDFSLLVESPPSSDSDSEG